MASVFLAVMCASTHAFTLCRATSNTLRFCATHTIATAELSTAELKASLIASSRAFKDADPIWVADSSASQGTATAHDVSSLSRDVYTQVDEGLASPLKPSHDEILGRLRNQTVKLIEELALRRPAPAPCSRRRPVSMCLADEMALRLDRALHALLNTKRALLRGDGGASARDVVDACLSVCRALPGPDGAEVLPTDASELNELAAAFQWSEGAQLGQHFFDVQLWDAPTLLTPTLPLA